MFGSYEINVLVGKLPQKVATWFDDTMGKLLGAKYELVAYLGSQQVNGTNHAILCEQTVFTGVDTRNVVLVIANEKPEGLSLVSIERVVESGAQFGGLAVDVRTEIPDEARAAFNKAFEGFVGSKVEPFALLATQVTKGINYVFAAELSPISSNPVKTVAIVTVNGMTGDVSFVDVLTSKHDVLRLGYAFTWLKRQNTSDGKPLSEWG